MKKTEVRMKLTNLQGAELINVLKSTMGSLWLITLESQEVEILQNVMIPELTGRVMDYKELIAIYLLQIRKNGRRVCLCRL